MPWWLDVENRPANAGWSANTAARTPTSSRAPSTRCTRPRASPTSASTPAPASGTTSSATTRPSCPTGWPTTSPRRAARARAPTTRTGWPTGAHLPGPPQIVQYNTHAGLRRRLRLLASDRRRRVGVHGRALRVAGALRQRRRQRPPRRGLRASACSTSTGGARSSGTAWAGSAPLDADRLVGFVNVAWDGGVHAFVVDTVVERSPARAGSAAGSWRWPNARAGPPAASGSTSTSRRSCATSTRRRAASRPTPAGLIALR